MPLPQKIRFDGETATLTVSEFRSQPGEVLDRVSRGMEITVTKNGKAVAVISPPETREQIALDTGGKPSTATP
jgi:prevent-host-death family protein